LQQSITEVKEALTYTLQKKAARLEPMGPRGESFYRRERYRAWVKLQQSHEDYKAVSQQQLLVCGNKRGAAGVSKRHAGLQRLAVFVFSVKPNTAYSYYDAACGDHKNLSDVLHGANLRACCCPKVEHLLLLLHYATSSSTTPPSSTTTSQ
jgi:hypothetical protein